jgi:hypothetical protein
MSDKSPMHSSTVGDFTLKVVTGERPILALCLYPDPNAIAVVTGSRNFWWQAAHSEILKHQDKARGSRHRRIPGAQLIEQINALPKRAVILFQLAPKVPLSPPLGAFDVLRAAALCQPTHSPWQPLCTDYGGVGGAYHDWESSLLRLAKIAARG